MKKQLFIPIFLLHLTFLVTGYAQTSQENIPQVNPLPPNTAALFKTLERPIGSYTGTVPVNFPLMSIGSGNLSANLSLDYNGTGGIKVDEIASSVGLGFSLNDGGGRIVQVVNDLPDFWYGGMLGSPNVSISDFICSTNNLTEDYDPKRFDLEPDIFMYHFNGQSGKFFFKQDGTLVMMQETGIKIDHNTTIGSNNDPQWVITDEQGNTYHFGHFDYGGYTTENDPILKVTSCSWYLTDVYDINEENKISYSYQGSGDSFYSFSGGHLALLINDTQIGGGGCGGFNLYSPIPNFIEVYTSENIVSRIEVNDGEGGFISINTSTNRNDAKSIFTRKVDNIQLYAPDSTLIKQYKFNYSYFTNPIPSSYPATASTSPFYRLKLDNFSEWGQHTTDSLAYTFEYNDSFGKLPTRNSTAVDLWGFYNGRTSNSSYFPNIVFSTGTRSTSKLNYANKNAYAEYAQKNILTKITYPTGGYREFEYEGNTALTIFNQYEYHPNPMQASWKEISITNENDFMHTNFLYPDFEYAMDTLTVNSDDGDVQFSYYLSKSNSGGVDSFVKLIPIDPDYPFYEYAPAIGPIYDMYGNSDERQVSNGFYRIEVYKHFTTILNYFNATWKENHYSLGVYNTPHSGITYNQKNTPVGGVRVKEIKDYDPVTHKTYKTEYKYRLYSADSTLTSGLLIIEPDLVVRGIADLTYPMTCDFYKLLSKSNYTLPTHGGSYVVYPEVRTIEHGNGWTDHIYSFDKDYYPSSVSEDIPALPLIDRSFNRGLLLEEKVFDQNGTMLKKITNGYGLYGWQIGQAGIRTKAYYYMDTAGNGGDQGLGYVWSEFPFFENQGSWPNMGVCNWFSVSGASRPLRTTIDSTFTTTGTFVTKTDYDYDFYDEKQLVLKRVKQTLNNGDVKTKTYNYTYTPDGEYVFGIPDAAIKSTLEDKNYRLPLETRDSLLIAGGTDVFLGGEKFIFSNSANKIRLDKVQPFKSTSALNALNFSSYSDYGKLQEQYRDNGTKEVYLWGYDGQYPVAKVTGSDYATISAMVNNSILQNPSSDAALRTELNKIRNNLAGTAALVTTYTYDPLIGITSMTDPKGYITYYEYDDFNRLKQVKDANGKILSENEYHYKN